MPRGDPPQAAPASAAEASLLHQRRLLRLLNRLTSSDLLRRRGVFGAHTWGRWISFSLAVLDIIDVGVARQSELCEGRGVACRLSRYPPRRPCWQIPTLLPDPHYCQPGVLDIREHAMP